MKEKFDTIRFLKFFFFIAIISTLVLACADDDDDDDDKKIKIQGTVSSGIALKDATVRIYNQKLDEINKCTSNDTGNFSCSVDKNKVSGVMVAVSAGLVSLTVSEKAPTKNQTLHINPITDYLAKQMGVDISKIVGSARNRRQLAQTLGEITVNGFTAQKTTLTTKLGINADTFISSTAFVPRVDGTDNSGSVADDFIEAIVENNPDLAQTIKDATTAAPVIADAAVQVRLASAALGRTETTAKKISSDLKAIVKSEDSIGVFERVAAAIEGVRTSAQNNDTVKADNNLVKVALESIEEALVSSLKNPGLPGAVDTAKGNTFVHLVSNMSNVLSARVINAVEVAAKNSNFKKDGKVQVDAVATVVSNAAIQAGSVALVLNLTSELSEGAVSFLRNQTQDTFNSTVTTLTNAIRTGGGATAVNLAKIVADSEGDIKGITRGNLSSALIAAETNPNVSGSVNNNANNISIPAVTLQTVLATTTTTTTLPGTTPPTPVPSGGAGQVAIKNLHPRINDINAAEVPFKVTGIKGAQYSLVANSSGGGSVILPGGILEKTTDTLTMNLKSLEAGNVTVEITHYAEGKRSYARVSIRKTNPEGRAFSIAIDNATLANSNAVSYSIKDVHSEAPVTFEYSITQTGSDEVTGSGELTIGSTTTTQAFKTKSLSELKEGDFNFKVTLKSAGVEGTKNETATANYTNPKFNIAGLSHANALKKAVFEISGVDHGGTYQLAVSHMSQHTWTGRVAKEIAVDVSDLIDSQDAYTVDMTLTDPDGNPSIKPVSTLLYVDSIGPEMGRDVVFYSSANSNIGRIASIQGFGSASTNVIYYGEFARLTWPGVPGLPTIGASNITLSLARTGVTLSAGKVFYSMAGTTDVPKKEVFGYKAYESIDPSTQMFDDASGASTVDVGSALFQMPEGLVTFRATISDTVNNLAYKRVGGNAIADSVVATIDDANFSFADKAGNSVSLQDPKRKFALASSTFFVQRTGQMYMIASPSAGLIDSFADMRDYAEQRELDISRTYDNYLATTVGYYGYPTDTVNLSVSIVGYGIAESVNIWNIHQWRSLFTISVSDNTANSAVNKASLANTSNWEITSTGRSGERVVHFQLRNIEMANVASTESSWIKITLNNAGLFHKATTAAILLVTSNNSVISGSNVFLMGSGNGVKFGFGNEVNF